MEAATRHSSRAGRDDIVLALLAIASSTTDVLSFLAFNGVFTSAMTGNTALLGMSAGEGRLVAASRSLAALIGFLVGVAAATSAGIAGAARLGGSRRQDDRRGHLTAALGLELLFLGLFAAAWGVSGGLHEAGLHEVGGAYVLIALSAVAMGVQSVAARQVNLPTIPTVVFTSSLTSIVMGATEAALRRRPLPADAIRQAAIFCAYLGGAVLAGVLALWHLASLVSVSLAAVALALALHVARPRG